MSSFPARIGLLAGVVVFLACGLLCLLRGGEPLATARRSALAAAVAAAAVSLSTRIALGVLHDGLKRRQEQREST